MVRTHCTYNSLFWVKVKVNDKNITRIQEGMVKTYKELDVATSMNQAPFSALKKGSFGRFYSILNDGIQKFCNEYNGVFLRTVDEDFDVKNLPWALTKIPGGLNAIYTRKAIQDRLENVCFVHRSYSVCSSVLSLILLI